MRRRIKNRILVIMIIVFGLTTLYLLYAFFSNFDVYRDQSKTQNENVNTLNRNNVNSLNNNNNTNDSIDVGQEVSFQGTVFVKGYKTPSESYGIITDEGHEIGFGKYDSMKEQFRAYTNKRISIIFSSVCPSALKDCCKTLFFYCGTVKTWQPIAE